jgi:hypothetical protein
MRGADSEQSGLFSYISAERRVPKDHPLPAIRTMADTSLKQLSKGFGEPSLRFRARPTSFPLHSAKRQRLFPRESETFKLLMLM